MTRDLKPSILDALAPFPEIELAIVFGSRARGSARLESDLDLAVAAATPLSPAQKRALIESLALATGHPIDLIDLLTAPVPLLSSIFSSGERVKNDDPELYAMLIRRLWNWNADMAANHEALLEHRRMKAFAT